MLHQSWEEPSKKELARSCKIVQESCKNLACKTCLARARDMSLFLHDSCTISHQFLQDLAKNVQEMQIIILAATLAPFLARYVQDCARIVQEMCKKRDISRARAKQVLHARFLQDSCTILHDFASSFLLGMKSVACPFFASKCFQDSSTSPGPRLLVWS